MPVINRSAVGLAALVGLTFAAGSPLAQPDTRPATALELEQMGFPADAENVDIAATASLTDKSEKVTPTTGVSYSTVTGAEFNGREDENGTAWRYGSPSLSYDLHRAGAERFADARFVIPDGATLRFFRWWAFDRSTNGNISLFLFEECQPLLRPGPIFRTVLVREAPATTGADGDQSLPVRIAGNRVVNNARCVYTVRAGFDVATDNLALQKVRVEFDR